MRTRAGNAPGRCGSASSARLCGRLSLRKDSSAMASHRCRMIAATAANRHADAGGFWSRFSGMSSLESIVQQATDERAVAHGRALVEIVAALTDDEDILTGAMLFALLEATALSPHRPEAPPGP